jgi:ABC-type uncharacterized transport system ATPase subunit
MKDKDFVTMRGDFRLVVKKNGVVIEEYEDHNMIMNVAKDAMAKLIGGNGSGKTVTKIGFGTNGSGPSPADTALTGSYSKNVASISYPVTGQAQFNWLLTTTEANGMSIKEFGLICGDATLFARKTRGAIEKQDDISLDGSWTIIF